MRAYLVEYVGGPLDGRVDRLPAYQRVPAGQIVLEGLDDAALDRLVEWSKAGAQGEPPELGEVVGTYRWIAHRAVPEGEAVEVYRWHEGKEVPLVS